MKHTVSRSKERIGPFAIAARDYFDAGWSPIPYAARSGAKAPLIKDFTGYHDNWPTKREIKEWISEHPTANIGIRLPKDVVGIDVDCYGSKAGARTLLLLEMKWGELPRTWFATSRTDGSGIYLLQVPADVDTSCFRDPGPGVEIIRWSHRFVSVAPSRHVKTGRRYGWLEARSDGLAVPIYDEIPSYGPGAQFSGPLYGPERADEWLPLGELPNGWAKGLATASEGSNRPRASVAGGEKAVWRWLGDTAGGRGRAEMCAGMVATLKFWLKRLDVGATSGGAYGTALGATHALIGDAASGCTGVRRAIDEFCRTYITSVSEDRPRGADGWRSAKAARGELIRMISDEVSKRQGDMLSNDDRCE